MVNVDNLSDAELRTKLLEYGFPVMPITGTTRKVMTKKLKLLMENKTKINSDTSSGRRSLGRYSSEEESDSDLKPIIQKAKKDNRRATMAAPLMQPPQPPAQSSNQSRRSTSRSNDTLESEVQVKRSPKKDASRIITHNVTRTTKILKSAQDEFDTGSDSESDVIASNSVNNSYRQTTFGSASSGGVTFADYSPEKRADTSFGRNISYSTASPGRSSAGTNSTYNSPILGGGSTASDYASDRLNQIRSRLSLNSPTYEKPVSYTSNNDPIDKEATPFLSNFTRRLTALSANPATPKTPAYESTIKEHESNNGNSISSYLRGTNLSSYRPSSLTRGRDATYDYKNKKSGNFVSFAVLIGVALFFVLLAVVYLGMRSDTSMVTSGYIVPACVSTDSTTKKGVNCLMEDEVVDAINLLNAIRPELLKRAVANKCFVPTIKPHMTEEEVISFCKQNYGLKDDKTIRHDLRNLEILTFSNPTWGIQIAQKSPQFLAHVHEEDIVPNMERLIFNSAEKITSLVIFNPDVPWRCTVVNYFTFLVKSLVFLVVVFGSLWAGNKGIKLYKIKREEYREEVSGIVERIVEILQGNAANGEGGGDGKDKFVVINHVRDMILPVSERRSKSKLWQEAVKLISETESRVRTEVQEVQGEPYEVWRWIGAPATSAPNSPGLNKTWQGQAFETQQGSVNSLPCSPTPCLKIRGMVEEGVRSGSNAERMIKEAVLGKLGGQGCRVLHCHVDPTSQCLYLKCQDQGDAAIAYRNLHGWWYAGDLVTVKYLRLERYMQRFPNSPANGPPYLKAAVATQNDWAN